ncbi:nonsense-mediated mRNA decay factor SMG8-like [Ciona intestinalis]
MVSKSENASSQMDGLWSLPFTEEVNAEIASQEVCVIGVFGKSAWGHVSKGMVLNKLTETSVFPTHYPDYSVNPSEMGRDPRLEKFMPKIEGYYDRKRKIVFLHLSTTLDAAALACACAEMGSKLTNHSDSHHFWKGQESEIVFSLVFLFSVCHILILVHPVSMFDISYDSLFHHISTFRGKLLPLVKDVLKECTVGRDWWVNGRPCPPRLLFVVQKSHLSNKRNPEAAGDATKKKKPPLKRLQHTLEDQIYKILRNSRVLTNNAINCLFTVPPNQAFVHIMTKQYSQVKRDEDPINGMLQLLRKSCETHRDPTAKSRAYRLLTNPPTQWEEEDEEEKENPLWEFLSQHTELVFDKKGFKDSVGRNPLPTHFELPVLKNWLKVANELFKLFFSTLKIEKDEEVQVKTSEIKQQLQVHLDPEMRFSEARCGKVVSHASAAYQANLPLHYTSKVHRNQLAQALATYALHARGPAKDKYEVCVQAECEAFWNDGRRLCEVRSLTGRHCVHRFHDLPDDLKPQPDANPPKMFHSSRSRSLAASSCGRIQGSREDPFTLKEANCGFYARLDARAHVLPDSDIFKFPIHCSEKQDKVLVSDELHKFVEQMTISGKEADESASKPKTSTPGGESEPGVQSYTQESEAEEVEEATETTESESRQRTVSANYEFSLNSDAMAEVEYQDESSEPQLFTEGMIHSQLALEGVLPLFSSWSLVRLGSSNLYTPNRGLEFPGFLPGTNYLVPWEISIMTEEPGTTHWPVPGEARKLPIKETKLTLRETTTKAYVGYEYETPRGQRFICSGPDKSVKVTSSGVVRDPIQPLLDLNMPLFTLSPVSGRSGKMLTGQLMRVIVVTPPESSVRINMKPQVVPGPSPAPTFYPSDPEISLRPNSMWVLRLPYVYVSESGPHIQPKDSSQLQAWRVLKMLSAEVDK